MRSTSAISFLLILFILVGLLLFGLGFFVARTWSKTAKKIKPQHPVKTTPKFTKNKLYLPKNFVSPWLGKRRKRKKITKNNLYGKKANKEH